MAGQRESGKDDLDTFFRAFRTGISEVGSGEKKERYTSSEKNQEEFASVDFGVSICPSEGPCGEDQNEGKRVNMDTRERKGSGYSGMASMTDLFLLKKSKVRMQKWN